MREKLETMSLAVLKDMAKNVGLKGISGLRKAELINLLCEHEEKGKQAPASKPQENHVQENRTQEKRSQESRPQENRVQETRPQETRFQESRPQENRFRDNQRNNRSYER